MSTTGVNDRTMPTTTALRVIVTVAATATVAFGSSGVPASARPAHDSPVRVGVTVAAPPAAVATATAADPERLGVHTRIGVHGAGRVRIGMTIRQAEAATGQEFVPMGDGRPNSACWSVRVKGYRGLTLMLKGRRIVRVDIGYPSGPNPTTKGIRRGDGEDAVKRAYPGRIRVEPHFYDRHGHYLVYTPSERELRNRRIVFETDGRKVTDIRAGRLPEVGYVEGCS